jgi:transcriptional regulator with XRE-family HTH domain
VLHNLGRNLRDRRRYLDLSQQGVADGANALIESNIPQFQQVSRFNQVYVSLLERGVPPREREYVQVLATVLGTTEAALLRRRRRPRVFTAGWMAREGGPVAVGA